MPFIVSLIAACTAFIHTIPFKRTVASSKTVIFEHIANEADVSWSNETRNEAANALLPVLFPKWNNNATTTPITAEASLKKLLRSRYRSNQANHTKLGDSGQIATLVLGTSVMRLRHWHVVAAPQENIIPPIPHPFDASLLLLFSNCTSDEAVSLEQQSGYEYELELTKAMVDEHIRYISGTDSEIISPMIKHDNDLVTKLSLQYSMPPFLTESLLRQYGYTTTQEIFMQSNAPGPITLRKNFIRFSGSDDDFCRYIMDQDEVYAVPMMLPNNGSAEVSPLAMYQSPDGNNRYKVGRHLEPGTILAPNGCIRIVEPNNTLTNNSKKLPKSIWSMKAWQRGYFEVQDVGSQLIQQSIEVQPGDSVLDYCAGNGGKTFGIASLLVERNNEQNCSGSISSIVAHDIVNERLRQIKGSMSRVGFTKNNNNNKVPTFSTANSSCQISIATSDQLQTTNTKFDVVLVDAPCSSTGVLRRRPSQRWTLNQKQVCMDLPKLQLRILKEASSYVRPGGKLVYSTCSLVREENEGVVEAFEGDDSTGGTFERWDFDPLRIMDDDGCYEPSEKRNTLTILPSGDSDGFFIARWKMI